MKNPFVFSGTVEGEAFCNRKQELNDLIHFAETSQNMLMYSHRRIGKTSLIKKLINVVEKQKPPIQAFYVDFYGTLSEKDFIDVVFKSFSQIETRIEKLGAILKNLFVSVRPKITFDPEKGKIDITPSYDPEESGERCHTG